VTECGSLSYLNYTTVILQLEYWAFQSEAIDMLAVHIGLHKDINYPTHTTQQFTMTTVSLVLLDQHKCTHTHLYMLQPIQELFVLLAN
jgi:hypothetical protein